jgi:hypothetical protein
MMIIPPDMGPLNPGSSTLGEPIRQPWEQPRGNLHGPSRFPPAPVGGATSPALRNPVQAVTASHWYAQIISVAFSVTTTSQRLLDQSAAWRNFLAIRNSSASANIYVGFGLDASTTASWLRLAAGTIVLFDTVVPQDDLYFIGDAAGSVAIGYSTTNR